MFWLHYERNDRATENQFFEMSAVDEGGGDLICKGLGGSLVVLDPESRDLELNPENVSSAIVPQFGREPCIELCLFGQVLFKDLSDPVNVPGIVIFRDPVSVTTEGREALLNPFLRRVFIVFEAAGARLSARSKSPMFVFNPS